MTLVKPEDPILHAPLEQFDFENPPVDPALLVEMLTQECIKAGGLAISANQIGLPYNCFVMVVPANPSKQVKEMIIPIFNCKIVATSEEEVVDKEGCLTFPNVFLRIKRPSWIRARYTDMAGNVNTERFTGLTARIIQHEYDHMQGVLFTSKVSKIHVSKAKAKAKIYARRK